MKTEVTSLLVIYLIALEVQDHAIPHHKTDICGECELKGPRRGSTFILCQAILISVLLHNEGFVPFVLISTVLLTSGVNIFPICSQISGGRIL